MALLRIAYVVAALLVVGGSSQTTQFVTCPNGPAPVSVTIDGCNELPCTLVSGSTLLGDVTFVVAEDTNTLTLQTKTTALGVTLNDSVLQEDACQKLVNAECPLKKGDSVTYRLQLVIPDDLYPTLELNVELNLLGDNNVVQACLGLNGIIAV